MTNLPLNPTGDLKLKPCHNAPCFEKVVTVILPMESLMKNDWSQSRFFCTEHAREIYVCMSTTHEGYIIGIVKEQSWDAWENREVETK